MKFGISLMFGVALTCLPVLTCAQPADTGGTGPSWKLAETNPTELMRQTIENELASSYGHRAPVRYQLRRVSAKSDTTKQIVETSDGGVARLIAVGGKPLSSAQEEQETRRLETLAANPSGQARRRREEVRDATKVQNSMRELPTAFLYKYVGSTPTTGGTAIRLTFEPNPAFTPPDFESRVLTGIRGEIWIDPEDVRVVRIDGQIFKPVDYGWGILGTLYPGAKVFIEQKKTLACGWQLAHLDLHLEGKALMFKSIHVVTDETATNYTAVPPSWTYRDAIRWMLRKPSGQTN